MFAPKDFFDLKDFPWPELFDGLDNVWDVLPRIKEFLATRGEWRIEGKVDPQATLIGAEIAIGPGTVVEAGVLIKAPTLIGPNCEIRQGAYLRGNVIAGPKAIVGHTTEAKNAVFLAGAQAAHFAYVGDSVLGRAVNLGAGTKLANFKVRSRTRTVSVAGPRGPIDTGLRKFGAILGDEVDIGCNAVTMPGTLVGPRSIVYPGVTVRGMAPADSIVKPAAGFLVSHREA
jgi:UDP-N-acetylglucosamine diphosphorylase / glucose-1-phosphate thymidylyltransferase / UDP-N-acetylgalactosamine diphosphorylase / glucosamine-1-phosphate N-acetyltransferase / galactosamine-1-phosphate N-acetyltransferase